MNRTMARLNQKKKKPNILSTSGTQDECETTSRFSDHKTGRSNEQKLTGRGFQQKTHRVPMFTLTAICKRPSIPSSWAVSPNANTESSNCQNTQECAAQNDIVRVMDERNHRHRRAPILNFLDLLGLPTCTSLSTDQNWIKCVGRFASLCTHLTMLTQTEYYRGEKKKKLVMKNCFDWLGIKTAGSMKQALRFQ